METRLGRKLIRRDLQNCRMNRNFAAWRRKDVHNKDGRNLGVLKFMAVGKEEKNPASGPEEEV